LTHFICTSRIIKGESSTNQPRIRGLLCLNPGFWVGHCRQPTLVAKFAAHAERHLAALRAQESFRRGGRGRTLPGGMIEPGTTLLTVNLLIAGENDLG
jgi:hypothetical protein